MLFKKWGVDMPWVRPGKEEKWGMGVPLVAQQVKDPVFSLLWLRSLLWLGFDPWPGNFCTAKKKVGNVVGRKFLWGGGTLSEKPVFSANRGPNDSGFLSRVLNVP